MKIIETDNYAGDYPDEKFLNLPDMSREHAQDIADAINKCFPDTYDRFWKVVPYDYKLQPGFEP